MSKMEVRDERGEMSIAIGGGAEGRSSIGTGIRSGTLDASGILDFVVSMFRVFIDNERRMPEAESGAYLIAAGEFHRHLGLPS